MDKMKEIYEKYLNEAMDFDEEEKEEFVKTLDNFIFEFGRVRSYAGSANSLTHYFNKKFGKDYPEMKNLALKLKMYLKLEDSILDVANKLYKKL